MRLANEWLVLRPVLDTRERVVTDEGPSLATAYTRLTCSVDADVAIDALRRHDDTAEAPTAPTDAVRLESIAVEMPSDEDGRDVEPVCLLFHTADGAWHPRLDPTRGTFDAATGVSRVELSVRADDVDRVAIVFGTYARVRRISFVAAPM